MPLDGELHRTRASLLNRLRNWEDNASWQEFFNLYWRLIYSVACKAGLNDAEAQDVVQETMRSVAKSMPTFRYDPSLGSFKAWLLNLTRWRIIGQFRKRGPLQIAHSAHDDSVTRTDPVEQIPDPAAAAQLELLWETEWKTNLLQAAVEKVKRDLDPARYQIFDFYVNKEWPAEKVAQTFSISVGQVYLTKNRITAMIRKEAERLDKEIA